MPSPRNSQVTELEDAPAAAPAPVQQVSAAHIAGLSGERRTVTIHTTGEQGGSEPVLVGVNGHHLHIPRGVPCSIPVEAVEVLQIARPDIYDPKPSGGGETVRQTQRVPFSVHG